MLNSSSLLWVRNVKRDHGSDWAYMEDELNDSFILHWSKRYTDEKEALKPGVGEVILLFQTPNDEGYTQLTHLVTPVSNDFIDCSDTNPDFPWGREVAVIAKVTGGINPKPHNLNFKPVNQTHSYEITNITSDLPASQMKSLIWNSFRPFLNPNFENHFEASLDVPPEDPGVNEGKLRIELRLHISRERNSEITRRKKANATDLKCECCGFDFLSTYGMHGSGYVECHHRTPINQGERITEEEDLALVCANCHRMLHRRGEDDEYLEVEELKTLIEEQKNK
ncbi:MAG: HNH endonuclease [Crocinitomicaceae bacterium]